MTIERELLKNALSWMVDLSDIYANERSSDDRIKLMLKDHINSIEALLAQPEHIKRSALTEAEISKTLKLSRRSTEWDYGFEAGVGFAEEFHGIGVDDGTH